MSVASGGYLPLATSTLANNCYLYAYNVSEYNIKYLPHTCLKMLPACRIVENLSCISSLVL